MSISPPTAKFTAIDRERERLYGGFTGFKREDLADGDTPPCVEDPGKKPVPSYV